MSAFRVYVAAPYADSVFVRSVHKVLRAEAFEPTSRWAETASAVEPLLTDEAMRAAALANDDDLYRSHAVLVLAREGTGGEMFAEARIAIATGIPVVWAGRRILSAYRAGVTRCDDIHEALRALRTRRDERRLGQSA